MQVHNPPFSLAEQEPEQLSALAAEAPGAQSFSPTGPSFPEQSSVKELVWSKLQLFASSQPWPDLWVINPTGVWDELKGTDSAVGL